MLKERVKEIVKNRDLTDKEKADKIENILSNEYYKYDLHDILQLSKEFRWYLFNKLSSNLFNEVRYSDLIDYLNDYYLADEE